MLNLFPYQVEGANFLASRNTALLADEMGVGKTAQAVRACDLVNAEKILIVCPAIARVNWQREFERFSPIKRDFQIIGKAVKTKNYSHSAIISYDLIWKSYAAFADNYDVLILDEAHYLKNHGSKRTRGVFGKTGLVRKAKRIWALTGTPAPNHVGELWPILFTFGVTKLGYDDFINRYCNWYLSPYKQNKHITGTKLIHVNEVKAMLSKIMLRRKKEEVIKDLPPIFYSDIYVEPGPVELDGSPTFTRYIFPTDRREALYAELKDQQNFLDSVVEKLGLTRRGLATLETISKSVSTLRQYVGCQKIEPVAKLITEELQSGAYEKVVIFAVHQAVIEGLRVRLRPFHPVTLFGGTDPQRRQKNVDKFQNNPRCRVFIGNIQAAGTAITLTAAHNVVFVEQSWVVGDNAQAAMRCHRVGQKSSVFVRFVGLENSIDEKISQVLKRKTRELTALFSDDNSSISFNDMTSERELSPEELELFN